MDHRQAINAFLIAAALTGAALPLPITEAKWIVGSERLNLLIRPPAECARPLDASAQIGKVAFQTQLLLGGQAARAGLSCQSCHLNGHDNPGFHFPAVSGSPGTADVTSSIMSSHRGDGQFNPKPIPNLTLQRHPKVSRAPGDPALEAFIRGLIVEEFDGAEPSPMILRGLADYIRALDSRLCSTTHQKPLTPEHEIDQIRLALAAANRAYAQKDETAARLMLTGGRAALQRLFERYQGPDLSGERTAILAIDAKFQKIQQDARGVPDDIARMIGELSIQLAKGQDRSLYNPKRLTKALRKSS